MGRIDDRWQHRYTSREVGMGNTLEIKDEIVCKDPVIGVSRDPLYQIIDREQARQDHLLQERFIAGGDFASGVIHPLDHRQMEVDSLREQMRQAYELPIEQ